jgi:hypothetical protein
MKKIILFAGLVMAGSVGVSGAQGTNQVATYAAITRTTVGALTPMLTNTMLNRLQNGASLALRYGNLPAGDINSANHAGAISAILPAGLGGNVRLTAGFNFTDCSDCDPDLMAGIGGNYRLIGSTMGTTPTSPLWTVGIDGEFGYGNRNPGTFLAGSVGVPIALVQRGEGMQFVPFVTPALGFGRMSGDIIETANGSAFMIGGGLGVYNSLTGVVINVAGQHTFTDHARTVIGVNVLFGGK